MTLLATSSGSQYTDEDRRRAVSIYEITGSIQKTSIETGIADRTLYDWYKSEWWESEAAKIREETKGIIRAKVVQIVHDGFDAIHDRIKNGDAYLAKDGTIARKPASLRDLGTVTGISFDKMRLIDNEPTSISSSNSQQLQDLAAQFSKLANTKVIEGTCTQSEDNQPVTPDTSADT